MSENLEKKSIQELQELFESTAKVLKQKQEAIRETAVAQISEIAKNSGIKVLIKLPRKKAGEQVEKIYRHPDNPELTWRSGGVGAPPKWLKDLIKATGKDKSEFEVAATPEQTA